MVIDKSLVKRILVITLSNAGDIILTTPVIRTLAREFPESRIDIMVGPAGKEIFEHDPRIFKVIIYDKRLPITEKRRLQIKLKKLKYDLVIDLRNTIFPLLIGPRFRTATIQHFPGSVVHRKDRHMYRLKSLGIGNTGELSYIYIPPEEDEMVRKLLERAGILSPVVVVNPGSKSHIKRWTAEGFAAVCDRLIDECHAAIVFTGSSEDAEVVEKVSFRMKHKPFNLVNKTNLRQLASLIKRSDLLITNDSAPLHIGCAVGAKVLALFGPTDPKKYGPTGEFDIVINKKLFCSPCENAECRYNHECMKLITPEEVFDAAKIMIEGYE